jgi:hypothetical protein
MWEGIFSALADTIYEMAGTLMVRTTAAYTSGSGSLAVEGTHRWPESGRIAVAGVTGFYATKTDTSFDGITDEDGNPGLPRDVRVRSVVSDISQSSTQLDGLRLSFLVAYAQGTELATLGRNYGISRPRSVDDDTYRELLKVLIYLDAQTIHACTKVLDALLGSGNYELYEDLVSDPFTVHVIITPTASTSSVAKTFLVGREPHASAGFTVTTTHPPERVHGIWDSADPFRLGTNFVYATISGFTDAGDPTWFQSGVAAFLPTDENQPAIIGIEIWKVVAYIDPMTIQLGQPTRADATLNSGSPDVLVTDTDWFRSWMVGHEIAVVAVNAGNSGIFAILEVLTPRSVRLSGATFTTETDVTWQLRPVFGTASPVLVDIMRVTIAGNVVTAPVALPVNVLVDYTTVDSAQLMESPSTAGVGAGASPFFLFDEGATVEQTLDLITAAGVRVVVES